MSRIVVVGAGIAGLGAAYRLQQAGLEVSVLEAEAEAGGRMRSRQWHGTWCDLGAGEVGGSFVELLGHCDELGLERIPHHGDEHLTMNVFKGGKLHQLRGFEPAALLRYSGMSVLDRLRVAKLLPSMIRQMRRNRGSHFEPWRGAWCDTESVETWLSRVAPGFLEYAMEPLFEGQATWAPHMIGRGIFTWLMAENIGADLYTFPEGLGQVTRSLASRLDVTTGARVRRVVAGRPVRIEYELDGQELTTEADMAVVAVPGSRVRQMVVGLDDDRRRFYEHVTYVPLDGVMFTLSRRPEGVSSYVYFPRREETDLARAGYQPVPTNPDFWTFNVLMKVGHLLRHRDASDDEFVDLVLDAVRPRFPEIEPLIEDTFVTRWYEGLPIFPAGATRALARLRELDPVPGVAFAGDYLCGPATGYAYVSGERAAQDVVGRLHPGP
jgi:oxygen-dependent protoporphyrinogen oxidase